MGNLSPSQFGICSWSTHPKDPADLIGRLKELGLKKIQLHLTPVHENPALWGNVQAELAKEGITIVSGMFGTVGEDYTSLETIKATGGFVPDQNFEANYATAEKVAKVAAAMKLTKVSCHAGFIPPDANDPTFKKLVEKIGKVALLFKQHGITLLFETGQETADTLWTFLQHLDKFGATNTGVNFDPANMILYSKGDPIVSLKKLLPRVQQVHIKDAVKTDVPGTWGKEVAIGDGQVDWKSFIQVLSDDKFKGDLVIEREAGQQRVADVRTAIQRIGALM
jgi:L-ribulose-5-phosphate 3-epimerase